jgi:hypothetical protein
MCSSEKILAAECETEPLPSEIFSFFYKIESLKDKIIPKDKLRYKILVILKLATNYAAPHLCQEVCQEVR